MKHQRRNNNGDWHVTHSYDTVGQLCRTDMDRMSLLTERDCGGVCSSPSGVVCPCAFPQPAEALP